MINTIKVFGTTLIFLLSGCGLSVPGFNSSENSNSNSNSSDYKIVLDDSYDGYGDDDELTSTDIDNGAQNFAECSSLTECSLLWDTAKEWVTEKSFYKSKLKTNSNNLLETEIDPRRKKSDKITFKVTRIPNGKTNIIKISATCPKNCKGYIDKEYFAFNSYLKNHLIAFKNGIIGYANIETSDNLDINFDDLSENNQRSVLEENNVLNKIEVTKSKSKRYIGKVAERLIDEYSCNKSSEINLVKKTRKSELYEVNCIKEVKRMIFDCGPDGCEVLQ